MNCKYRFTTVLFLTLINLVSMAQENKPKNATPDDINKAMMKLIEYYESYEDGSTQSQKNAKFDRAFDELSGGTANSKDKNDAFKIVDAYIKADQSTTGGNANNTSVDDFIRNTEEYKKAEKSINQGYNNLMNMSYPEFEKTVLSMQPNKGRREVKETYNKMHKNDGKQVAISAADDELTPQQQILWAVKAIENPKDYDEFVKAAKILNPKISDEKLKKGWEKYKMK